jgi:hypothetical protein
MAAAILTLTVVYCIYRVFRARRRWRQANAQERHANRITTTDPPWFQREPRR